MLIQPTTKKLSDDKLAAAIDCERKSVIKLFDDEKFYQIPRYPKLFISQYGRIIQTYKKAPPRLMNPSYDSETGYTTIVLTSGHGKRKCWGVHALVALVWLKKPDYEPSCFGNKRILWWKKLEVHHLKKVKANLEVQPIDVNWAENLRYIYRKYHKKIDTIKKWKYRTRSGAWKKARYIDEIAEYYEKSEKEILELLLKKPTETLNKWDYYIADDMVIGVQKYRK